MLSFVLFIISQAYFQVSIISLVTYPFAATVSLLASTEYMSHVASALFVTSTSKEFPSSLSIMKLIHNYH